MPQVAIAEWNEYLDWEIAQWTSAIMGAIPAAKSMGGNNAIKLNKPEEIENLFDALNKGSK